MKKLNFRRIIRLIFALSVVLFFGSTCTDDDEPTPDYTGKWVTEKPIAVTSGYVSIKYYLELTNNEFKETFIRPSRSSYSNGDQLSLEGSVSSSAKILKLTIHKLSVSNYDPVTGIVSNPHETLAYKDQDFGFEFEGAGMSTSNHEIEFSIIDGKLICKVDYNRDGIYSENEKSIYFKQ